MPRSARLARPHQYYHIYNRGTNHQLIYQDKEDYQRFLDKLKQTVEVYDWKIYTYCLLPNHYHLQIKTGKDKLGKIIQSLQTSHAIYFNRKHKHLGPIFQNRFHSVLVQEGEYFLYLSKYIHLNPVKSKLTNNPEDYPYSSYQTYLNHKNTKGIIDARSIKVLLGKQAKKSVKKYKQFIESPDKNTDYIYSEKNAKRGIFGTTRFRSQFE